jgi:hypothetical protein
LIGVGWRDSIFALIAEERDDDGDADGAGVAVFAISASMTTFLKITCSDASTGSRSRKGAHGAEAVLQQHRRPSMIPN